MRVLPLAGSLIFLIDFPVSADIDGGASSVYRPATRAMQGWSIDVGAETVGDRVDHEPHAAGGGFQPATQRQRYLAGHLGLNWTPAPAWQFSTDVAARRLTSKRDIYTLMSLDTSVKYRLPVRPSGVSLTAAGSFGTNRAKALEKNSYTRYEDFVVTSARLNKPGDWHVQGNLIASKTVMSSTQVSAYIGAGRALSDFDGFSGRLTDDDNCQYEFEASASAGSVQLAKPCNSVLSFDRTYTSLASFEEDFEFDSQVDFINANLYGQFGVQWQRATLRSIFGVGYHYQRFARGAIDQRIRERGITPILSNHSFSAWWAYRLRGGWSLNAGVEYSRHPLLNRLSFLYTGYTTDKFRTAAATMTLGLRYDFGVR